MEASEKALWDALETFLSRRCHKGKKSQDANGIPGACYKINLLTLHLVNDRPGEEA